ncbi:hypothetical protein EV421DRAFT_1786058 [Armillaria borealis]|uniref:Uncharacterized protein n=1 Tax=Armillaria borealis TaxID=47425 RepID=A0AA39JSU7_9AGAR|nr:hypothetical protein EV421DRAFT_1786058 [Armillaria borealis]
MVQCHMSGSIKDRLSTGFASPIFFLWGAYAVSLVHGRLLVVFRSKGHRGKALGRIYRRRIHRATARARRSLTEPCTKGNHAVPQVPTCIPGRTAVLAPQGNWCLLRVHPNGLETRYSRCSSTQNPAPAWKTI